jgi:hypothetical protein
MIFATNLLGKSRKFQAAELRELRDVRPAGK